MTEEEKEFALNEFELWWINHGSGMPPYESEDGEEHVRRIARIAWMKALESLR